MEDYSVDDQTDQDPVLTYVPGEICLDLEGGLKG